MARTISSEGKSAGPALRSSYINNGVETLAYRLDTISHAAVQDLLAMYNPLIGPVRKAVTYFGNTGSLPVHVGHSEFYDLDYVLRHVTGLTSFDSGAARTLFAGGKGGDLHGMFVSSVAETVERVLGSLSYFDKMTDYVTGSYDELTRRGFPCLAPEDLPLFSEEQYADPDFLFERFTRSSPVAWMRGERLLSGEAVWLPAQLVELVYPSGPDEPRIGYSVSGGLSSHISRREALFHGITECLERDAVNLRWHCRIPPRRIVVDKPPASVSLRRLLAAVERLPGKMSFYEHALDVPEVPVVTAIEVDPWLNRFAYYSGGGADINIDLALTKALGEFGQAERPIRMAVYAPERYVSQAVTRLFDMDPDAPASKIDLFFKVIAYYGYRQNAPKLDWYTSAAEEVPLSELPRLKFNDGQDKYDYLIDVVRQRGFDPIVFDMTPPQMKQGKLMKAFFPDLTQPFIQSSPILGHPRFQAIPAMMGMRDGQMAYEDLLQDPLPYP